MMISVEGASDAPDADASLKFEKKVLLFRRPLIRELQPVHFGR